MNSTTQPTISALSTATGGAIALIRLSGPRALTIASSIFSKSLVDADGYTVHYGNIHDASQQVVDQALATVFRAPRSYTGEDMVEFSCHGSSYVTGEVLRLLNSNGARAATAGEFTMRAFLNGKLDLAQAEAVADLIAAESRSSAQVAISQMRGGYSAELLAMNQELLHILSLLELELDFGEEDVEFADRSALSALVERIYDRVCTLSDSFRLGNVLKNGVPVAIVGRPNVGKSTLLNRLLGEERAIVSPTAGTTRDFIEERLVIDDVQFRFIDTAGLRAASAATDDIERLGIERSYQKLRSAQIVLQLVDSADQQLETLDLSDHQRLIVVVNKCDDATSESYSSNPNEPLHISAKYGQGIDQLKAILVESVGLSHYDTTATIVSNARHHEALENSRAAFKRALDAISSSLPTDIISSEIRSASAHISEITGEITTDDILGNIFSKFCIGK